MWCVVQTETRREMTAARWLARAGYEAYVPRIVMRRQGDDRVEPLFPGYLFACADETNWTPIRWTVAVVRIVMDGMKPAALPETELLKIRRREGKNGLIRMSQSWVKGQTRLAVIRGTFRGFEGIFQDERAHKRVQILLAMLGGEVSVELPVRDVEVLPLAS
jgi:transcriptional antiterminator RfaH